MLFTDLFESAKNACPVCGQTPCNCTHVNESIDSRTDGVSDKQAVNEMDKSQPSHGRDGKISHSTYGSRDKHNVSTGPDKTAKMTTADRMMKDAHKTLMRTMSDADKVKKGWRNPNMKESGVAEGLADDFMKMAREKGFNPRLRGTPDEERARTQQMLAQRAADRAEQEKQIAQADAARLPELQAQYDAMKKKYDSLGGSNWQYADREQNLSDAEREARSMEPALHNLHGKIARAKAHAGADKNQTGNSEVDEAFFGDLWNKFKGALGSTTNSSTAPKASMPKSSPYDNDPTVPGSKANLAQMTPVKNPTVVKPPTQITVTGPDRDQAYANDPIKPIGAPSALPKPRGPQGADNYNWNLYREGAEEHQNNEIVASLRRLREADPAYTGIDPVVRSRMGMAPAGQDEIRNFLDKNPPVVRSGTGEPVRTGTGGTVQSGGAVDVARAADAASPDRSAAVAKPAGTAAAAAPASAPASTPSISAATTSPVKTPNITPTTIPPAAKAPAQTFSKGVTDIATANKIADPNKINVGQTIKLPTGQNYTVAKGDTLSGIASGQFKGATSAPAPTPGSAPAATTPAPAKPAATPPSTTAPTTGTNVPKAPVPGVTPGQSPLGKTTPPAPSTASAPAPQANIPADKNIRIPNMSGAGQSGPTKAAATGYDPTNQLNKLNYGTGNSAPPPIMFNRMAPGAVGPVTKEAKGEKEPPEADYGDEYQAMVARVKKLAGLGPLKTVWDPQKRVYKNVPVSQQSGDKK